MVAHNASLGVRGWEVLDQPFPGTAIPAGEKLAEVTKAPSKDWSSIGDFIGGVFGGMTKSIGGGP